MTSEYKALDGPLEAVEVEAVLTSAYVALFNPNNTAEETREAIDLLAGAQAEAWRLFRDSHVVAQAYRRGVWECIICHLYSPLAASGLVSLYSYDECQELFSTVSRYVKPGAANRERAWRTLNQLYDACDLSRQAQLDKGAANGS